VQKINGQGFPEPGRNVAKNRDKQIYHKDKTNPHKKIGSELMSNVET